MLFERGDANTAFRLLTSEGKGSFYNMKKQGATTIWENWDGERSHSHPMFGAATRYLFSFILGITQENLGGLRAYFNSSADTRRA